MNSTHDSSSAPQISTPDSSAPVSRCIYLNNAATSYPKPVEVLNSLQTFLTAPPLQISRGNFESQSTDLISGCRQLLANLFNAPDPNRIIFTSGATESLNLALRGLPLKGRHVITTAIEHNSVLRPLKTMERDGLITLSIVPCDLNGSVSPQSIEDIITSCSGASVTRTSAPHYMASAPESRAIDPESITIPTANRIIGAIVVNHCSNVTGVVNDIGAIGTIARKNGISFIVDASQSAGVHTIDVERMNIDILAFTGHKSLYGIQGIGALYIRNGIELTPLKTGGTGVRSDYLYQPESMPMYYEAGTQNLPGICSLFHGITHILEKGMDNLRLRRENLVHQMKSHLMKHDAVRVWPDENNGTQWAPPDPTCLFSFIVSGIDPSDIGYILDENYGIIVRTGLHCAPLIHEHIGTSPAGSVRVSPSFFTTDKEVETFNSAMDDILEMVSQA